ncbi:phosphoribosylaminoimidazolesuccinocarboxamide synthase [Prochlorococcus marinus]|uniref:Phosphoribosylaminoimidazole-succinocarboxamide synthase n=1 Tax=Prochlorococcus marinus (strain MIT 9211) TaxID=93059 RepID=PUR7_PROM4|nr:phosphoribosylaminoimidazolesuccinocarboxamide synthase [Prochlorococcus marinus]A9BBW2.1 RecName: Full=Phosphoribosylaminoimidazole-succinocarboxamide synthase; AltName: Full=SAICAR synthetase [Prochlorococcus marinus str. MIT 9211]ABX09324.1 SAICAR synthetase [Prochlorococcus marinus str. MIT 9211]
MKKQPGSFLFDGKAKTIFTTDKPYELLVHFKNDATAFNALKHAELEGKGKLNCQISASLFQLLEKEGVPTHFLGVQDETWMLVQKVDVIPLEIVVRNIACGSLCKETPLERGEKLSSPLLDFYYKDDQLGDPLLTDARLNLLGLTTSGQRLEIQSIAFKVNNILKNFFQKIDLLLVDFKLEMGLNNAGELLVADEISPDSCRLWDQRSDDPEQRILDKDRFRQDLGGVVEAYGEILKRIQGNP